jgi:hypothetical protein
LTISLIILRELYYFFKEYKIKELKRLKKKHILNQMQKINMFPYDTLLSYLTIKEYVKLKFLSKTPKILNEANIAFFIKQELFN